MQLGDYDSGAQLARRALRSVDLLSSLHSGQLHRLGDALVEMTFEEGETIVKQGDTANTFYVVTSGSVSCSVRKHADNEEEEPKEVMRLGAGDVFGERSLLANSKTLQTASPVEGPVTVLCITRAGFEEVLGPLQNIINADRKFRERNAAQREMIMRRPSWGSGEVVSPIPGGGGEGGGAYASVFSPLGPGRMSNVASPGEENSPREGFAAAAAAGAGDGDIGSVGGVGEGEGEGGDGAGIGVPRGVSPTACINFTSPRASVSPTFRRRSSHHFTVADVVTTDVLYTTSVSQLCLASHVPGRTRRPSSSTNHDDDDDDDDVSSPLASSIITVKQYSLTLASASGPGMQAAVMRERHVMKSLSPMPFIPANLGWARDDTFLTVVINTRALCTLDNLVVSGGPLRTPAAVRYYAASVALALEHLHMCGVVYRSTNPETLLIDEDGRVQVTDFRLCKELDGRTYTMCGAPEYLAPEVVEGVGHNQAADWWSLGVLVFYLHTGNTPFANPGRGGEGERGSTPATPPTAASQLGRILKPRVSAQEVDDEKDIFRRITDMEYSFPEGIPEVSRALISELLAKDPNQRLGYGSGGTGRLRSHAFFEGIEWDGLMSVDDAAHDRLIPPEMVERLGTLTPTAVEPLRGALPYSGDTEWFKEF